MHCRINLCMLMTNNHNTIHLTRLTKKFINKKIFFIFTHPTPMTCTLVDPRQPTVHDWKHMHRQPHAAPVQLVLLATHISTTRIKLWFDFQFRFSLCSLVQKRNNLCLCHSRRRSCAFLSGFPFQILLLI
jgi:hypothetical protein